MPQDRDNYQSHSHHSKNYSNYSQGNEHRPQNQRQQQYHQPQRQQRDYPYDDNYDDRKRRRSRSRSRERFNRDDVKGNSSAAFTPSHPKHYIKLSCNHLWSVNNIKSGGGRRYERDFDRPDYHSDPPKVSNPNKPKSEPSATVMIKGLPAHTTEPTVYLLDSTLSWNHNWQFVPISFRRGNP